MVYAKPPWNGAKNALKYLARYTHRVAIANSRIQSMDHGQVSFTYKDYRNPQRRRTLTLDATEFIRRFMMHVLPHGFMRIRYYGFLANKHRKEQLRRIRELLDVPQPRGAEHDADDEQPDFAATLQEQRCPRCQRGMLLPTLDFTPRPTHAEILNLPSLAPT